MRLRLGGECPATVRNKAVKLFLPQEDWQLPIDRYADLPAFLDAARQAGHAVRIYDDVLKFIAEQRDAEHRRRSLDAAYPQGARSPALKNIVKIRLYPYQAEGALFAAHAGRVLLGDEMGLGKTVQAIAAAELLARHFGVERVLIVCPTSLKYQWQREFARFTAREATVIGGLRAARQALYAADGLCKITNYDTLARDLDLIQAWRPDLVIVDEAQRSKNWHTIAARMEAHRVPLCVRAHRYAALKSAGRTHLHRAVRRSISARPDLAVIARTPTTRRPRARDRLSEPRPDRPHLGADHAASTQGRSAGAIASAGR